MNEERLRCNIKRLQEEWELLSEKLSRLERQKILEHNVEEIFRLEHRIAEIAEERRQIEQQLRNLESQLSLIAEVKVTLTVEQGSGRGKTFEFIEPDTFIVGRSKKAHFSLGKEDRYVSRSHFMLEIAPPKCYIKDLRSANGTEVNGRQVERVELKDGDKIKVGLTEIRVRIDEKPSELEPQPDEEVTLLFDNSEEKTWILRDQSTPGPRFSRTCFDCAKDLSAIANSDGRAEELKDIVTYLCDDCFDKRKMPVDIDEIGDYRVLRELGKGAIGVVYAAVHKPTGRLITLKKIRIEKAKQRARRRFIRGMHIMEQIIHPNVVRLLGQGIHNDAIYVASEYLAGGSAKQLITDTYKGPVPPKVACQIIVDVLKGLEYFHQRENVHRAIKPTNILLTKTANGETGSAKLADFGLAKSYSDAGGSVITDVDEVAGKLIYMAPEQISDFKNVKPSADLYSIGVSLYELLTAKLPFEPQPKDIVLIVLEDYPVLLRTRNSNVPEPLAEVVDQSIRKDVEERFSSAVEFRKKLERVMEKL